MKKLIVFAFVMFVMSLCNTAHLQAQSNEVSKSKLSTNYGKMKPLLFSDLKSIYNDKIKSAPNGHKFSHSKSQGYKSALLIDLPEFPNSELYLFENKDSLVQFLERTGTSGCSFGKSGSDGLPGRPCNVPGGLECSCGGSNGPKVFAVSVL